MTVGELRALLESVDAEKPVHVFVTYQWDETGGDAIGALLGDVDSDGPEVLLGGEIEFSELERAAKIAGLGPETVSEGRVWRTSKGTVVTDAEIEEWAAEAERGYDVDKLKGREVSE